MPRVPRDPMARWLAKVDKDGPLPTWAPFLGPCWVWTAGLESHGGYPWFWGGDGAVRAHRWGYERLVGPIPEGLHLDHLCRVRHCVNPAHLEPVTCKVNVLRGQGVAPANAAKTHCVNGHEFTPENTYWRTRGQGRDCRTCKRAATAASALRLKAAARGVTDGTL